MACEDWLIPFSGYYFSIDFWDECLIYIDRKAFIYSPDLL